MATLFMRLEHGAIDLAHVACPPTCAQRVADFDGNTLHVHLAATKIRRWHPGYWLLIARATLALLRGLRIRWGG